MTEERKTALVVEDTAAIRISYERQLQDRGYKVTSASYSWEALEYKDSKFDLLITDGLEGECFEVVEGVQAVRKVVISGDWNVVEECRKMGLEAYLKSRIKNFSEVIDKKQSGS